jgi:hypothetical protein
MGIVFTLCSEKEEKRATPSENDIIDTNTHNIDTSTFTGIKLFKAS